jgi:hypothetical protein
MKVRTTLIFVCMIVVPALALFSHQLPAEVRTKVRSCLWEPVEAWAMSLTRRDEASEPEGIVDGTQQPADPASAPRAEARTLPAVQALASNEPAAALPASALAAPANPSGLAALGAVAIDCRPFDDAAGTHVASCRVAVDASGQLHRVFQAAGRSPDEAMAALEQAVRAWQSRRGMMARGAPKTIQL